MSADEFNAKYPIGTTCRIRFSKHDLWNVTRTRTPAWALGHGDVVVSVEGKTGGWSIDPEWFEIIPIIPTGDET